MAMLEDNDGGGHSLLSAAQPQKAAVAPPTDLSQPASTKPKPAQDRLPSKPVPRSQAVREVQNEGAAQGGGRSRGHGAGLNKDSINGEEVTGASGGCTVVEEYGDRPHVSYHGNRPPRRLFDRRRGTGRGNELKRDGAGRGNWGTLTDEISQGDEELTITNGKNASPEKQAELEDEVGEKEPEDKEMTLDEYQKLLEEKRKALQPLKVEQRKVIIDKDFETMIRLSNKKTNDDIFIKLGSDKDKREETAEKEEKAKCVSINEFLKPADGRSYGSPGGQGRGHVGRGFQGGYAKRNYSKNVPVAAVDQFPILGA